MAPKHVPLRTCVQCQQVRPKRDLIRIVRTCTGNVEIDEKGKAAGRGAYLCRNKACWEAAISRERLDYALKMKLTLEQKERLLAYGQQLPCADAQQASPGTQHGPVKGERDSQHG